MGSQSRYHFAEKVLRSILHGPLPFEIVPSPPFVITKVVVRQGQVVQWREPISFSKLGDPRSARWCTPGLGEIQI